MTNGARIDLEALPIMVRPREAKSTGRPGAAPLAPGRSAARGARPRLAAVVAAHAYKTDF